jgi:hypothetical protein
MPRLHQKVSVAAMLCAIVGYGYPSVVTSSYGTIRLTSTPLDLTGFERFILRRESVLYPDEDDNRRHSRDII